MRDHIQYDFLYDNQFAELKEAELLRERLQTLDMMQQYVGEFFSKEHVMKSVLFMDDSQINDMKKQIADERASGEIETEEEE